VHHVTVLIAGYSKPTGDGRYLAAGTVTLIHGAQHVLVDTGDPGQRQQLLDALGIQGLSPADIAFVVNTHGHLDHIGNNNLFAGATFILDTDVSRDGVYWTHDFDRGPLHLPSAEGDAPVTVMRTPGHTDHDLSVIVDTSIGAVAIVGDLFEYQDDDTERAWIQWSRDPQQQRASRDAVLALARYIVPGHGDMFAVASELRDRDS
jgi:glyoxylase-like metal-dependent hydrolase (beta-lactamase superfamily II)